MFRTPTPEEPFFGETGAVVVFGFSDSTLYFITKLRKTIRLNVLKHVLPGLNLSVVNFYVAFAGNHFKYKIRLLYVQ